MKLETGAGNAVGIHRTDATGGWYLKKERRVTYLQRRKSSGLDIIINKLTLRQVLEVIERATPFLCIYVSPTWNTHAFLQDALENIVLDVHMYFGSFVWPSNLFFNSSETILNHFQRLPGNRTFWTRRSSVRIEMIAIWLAKVRSINNQSNNAIFWTITLLILWYVYRQRRKRLGWRKRSCQASRMQKFYVIANDRNFHRKQT